MNLQVVQITDPALPGKERVHLSVLNDATLSYYILMKSYIVGTGVANGIVPAFWFPTVSVKRGDQVVVYTGLGQNTSVRALAHTNHFFYWGMSKTIFGEPGTCAVLAELTEWQSRVRPDPPK